MIAKTINARRDRLFVAVVAAVVAAGGVVVQLRSSPGQRQNERNTFHDRLTMNAD